jgi:hypothetical protein
LSCALADRLPRYFGAASFLAARSPAQGAVAVVDVRTLTTTGNIADPELNRLRAVRFPHY